LHTPLADNADADTAPSVTSLKLSNYSMHSGSKSVYCFRAKLSLEVTKNQPKNWILFIALKILLVLLGEKY